MNKKIAILVIHGIGEQEPFETLDAFARNFFKVYSKLIKSKSNIKTLHRKHSLVKRKDWIESYVKFYTDEPTCPQIDIYEYYWASMTQRKITAPEIFDWIVKVARGARSFYRKKASINKNIKKNDVLFKKDGEFKQFKYLVRILSFGNLLKYIFAFILSPFLINFTVFRWIITLVSNVFKGPFVDFFGDVALYCGTDKKSQYYEVRQKILNGAVEEFRLILEDSQYTDILLVGHSLGTVIAYDSLDRLNKEMNVNSVLQSQAPRIKGLITFGSPLDKIAFFFDEKIEREKQSIRYAIVSQLHSFKRENDYSVVLENGVQQYLAHVNWLNFWTKPDPVSGHLDVYKDVKNIEMDFSEIIKNAKISVLSHSLYWKSEKMYQDIINEFGI